MIGVNLALEEPSRQGPITLSLGSLRVLLAEDNLVNQKLSARILEKEGHSVMVVSNGMEAVAAVAFDAFDVILMDVQMPEMDGFEATRIFRTGARSSCADRCNDGPRHDWRSRTVLGRRNGRLRQ